MKKLLLLVLGWFYFLSAVGVDAALYYIPPTSAQPVFKAKFQSLLGQQTYKTNVVQTTTNVFWTLKSTVTNDVLHSVDILKLLANSFQTNFPAGAKLSVNGNRFFVVDSSGSNVLLNASSVFSISLTGYMQNSLTTRITTQTNGGSSLKGNLTSDLLFSATLSYDDTSLATTDGTHAKFALYGLWKTLLTQNIVTYKSTAVFVFTGGGGGTIRDIPVFLDAIISGHGSGQPAS